MGTLRFRILYISNILIVALLAPLNHFAPIYFLYFILIELAFLSFLFLACTHLSWNFFIPTLCKAKTNEKVVALSFDDGPAGYTQGILDTLKQLNAHAAFFCIGKNIPGNEQVLRRINEEGHLIGNHSYTHHFWFDMWSTAKMADDIQKTDKEIEQVTDLRPLLFRPPYGVINPNLAKAIKGRKYTSIGWSIRSFDTKITDKEKLLSKILNPLKPGDIILLHDSIEITSAILPELIARIKTKGFNIIRLDKMLNIAPYA